MRTFETDTEIRKRFGARVRELRLARKMSQGDLELLADVNRCRISMIECGKNLPQIATAVRLADALEVSLAVLMGEPELIDLSDDARVTVARIGHMNLRDVDKPVVLAMARQMVKAHAPV